MFLALAPDPLGSSRLAVLKKLRPEMLDQPELVAMFLDEARLAARLNHPNIVHTYEVGVSPDDGYFIAMELLEGQPLNKIRARGRSGTLGVAAWVSIVADALAGLHYAHELCDFDGMPLGIVHRDVSPHNIFVTYEGGVKLVDFGVAKAALNREHTQVGAIKGKASYMAPEQICGEADRRSDVFAMGAVLWEVLAGRKLFTGTTANILHRVLYEPVPRLSGVLPGVAPEIEAIVACALERDPGARFPTARAMREALLAYLAGTAGGLVRSEDIGRWLRSAFADEYEQGGRQAQAARAGESYEPATRLPLLPGSARPFHSLPSLPLLSTDGAPASESQLGMLMHASADKAVGTLPVASRAPRGVVALGLVVAAAALVVMTVRSSRHLPPPASAPGRAPAPVVTTLVAPAASLEVHSEPAGAQVSWGGKPLGATPLKLELPPGDYTLLLSKAGYRSETLAIELPEPGAFASRAVALQATPSSTAAVPRPPRHSPSNAGRRHPALLPPGAKARHSPD